MNCMYYVCDIIFMTLKCLKVILQTIKYIVMSFILISILFKKLNEGTFRFRL